MSAAAVTFVAIGFVSCLYWLVHGRNWIGTDNAYVNGNVVQITPQTAGTVVAIAVDDTDRVEAGRLLVQLDPTDAEATLDQAEATLARTVRDVRTTLATTGSLRAQVTSREADLARARADYQRRLRLRTSGAVSREDLAHTEAQLHAAEAQADSSRQQLTANLVQTEATTLSDHPAVRSAAAAVRQAYVAYERTKVPAPVTGYVAKRSVQLGERVQPGSALMAVIALDHLWVEANFKESQLAKLRIGQAVELVADLYGDAVRYHGKVEGLAPGTGSAFSLLPAQNATGNWIKIVQRVPVRISLDASELAAHPLRIGLSMQVDVDVHDTSGLQLASASRADTAYQTDVFEGIARAADARVASVIKANGGGDSVAQVQH